MDLNENIIKRMVFIRYMYDQGVEQSKNLILPLKCQY